MPMTYRLRLSFGSLALVLVACAPAAPSVVPPTFTALPTRTPTTTPTHTPVPTATEPPTAVPPDATRTPARTATPRATKTPQPTPTSPEAPIGHMILYQTTRAGLWQLWGVDADTGRLLEITKDPVWAVQSPAWSPDGQRIAFTAFHDLEAVLRVTDWMGDHETSYSPVNQYSGYDPAWAPDGNSMAFIAPYEDYWAIYTLDLLSGESRRLTEANVSLRPISWASTGTAVAFTMMRPLEDPSVVARVDLAGGAPVELTHRRDLYDADGSPVWSPDGSFIAYNCSDEHTVTQICLMNADGGHGRALTHGPGGSASPVWSPDGSRLAFDSWRNNPDNPNFCFDVGCNIDIYTINVDGTNETRLTSDEARDWGPAWSPDGTRIAFASERDETRDWLVCQSECNSNIYVMDADGSNVRRLTESHTPDWNPQWRPIPPEPATVR